MACLRYQRLTPHRRGVTIAASTKLPTAMVTQPLRVARLATDQIFRQQSRNRGRSGFSASNSPSRPSALSFISAASFMASLLPACCLS
jgi:hypothetical protein